MVGRRSWKGIVINVAESFVSRNNDVDGYWGIGKLHLFAIQQDVDVLRLNIFQGDPSYPPFWEAQVIQYREMIQANARSLGLRWDEAVAELQFEPPSNRLSGGSGTEALRGFRCEITIRDDLGRAWSHSIRGRSHPHNPHMESKSSRAA